MFNNKATRELSTENEQLKLTLSIKSDSNCADLEKIKSISESFKKLYNGALADLLEDSANKIAEDLLSNAEWFENYFTD